MDKLKHIQAADTSHECFTYIPDKRDDNIMVTIKDFSVLGHFVRAQRNTPQQRHTRAPGRS